MATSSSGFDMALGLSRFGLGSGPQGVPSGDIRERLRAEISEGAVSLTGLGATPDLLAEVYAYQKDKRADRRDAKAAAPETGSAMMTDGKNKREPGGNPVRQALNDEIQARFDDSIRRPVIGFNERMVMFWANHFAVSTKKSQPVGAIAGAYEREAIRPHVFGRFEDLLLAAETHPCMLLYLDNAQSVGPNAPAGQRNSKGLNENLAREILELHTLGVGSGYTQADVTAFAKIITGWSVRRNDQNGAQGEFVFQPRSHEPGPQTVMGKTYAQAGIAQGQAVLADLARHPATAQHIATKLARHFVSDTPPPALVAKLEQTFLKSDGDLAELSRALIEAPEAWTPERAKIRSPQEYVAAVVRATGVNLKPQAIHAALNAMGQPWWQPAGPNGFPDTVAAWAAPEGLSTRMDFASGIAARIASANDPRDFAESRLGALLSDPTRTSIARAETRAQGLNLAFLSPEFMRR